jgi:hypothetical protein
MSTSVMTHCLFIVLLVVTLTLAQPPLSELGTTTAPPPQCAARFELEPCTAYNATVAACRALQVPCASADNCEPSWTCIDGLQPLNATCAQAGDFCLIGSIGAASRGVCTEALKCVLPAITKVPSPTSTWIKTPSPQPEFCAKVGDKCVTTDGKAGVCREPKFNGSRKRLRIALECATGQDAGAASLFTLSVLTILVAAIVAMR